MINPKTIKPVKIDRTKQQVALTIFIFCMMFGSWDTSSNPLGNNADGGPGYSFPSQSSPLNSNNW